MLVGGAYGEKMNIRRCLALELSHKPYVNDFIMLCLEMTILFWLCCQETAPRIRNEPLSEECFFIDDEDFLS